MEGLLTIDQTAHFTGVSSWTIRYWIRQGKLASVKIGRRVLVERAELNKLVADNRRISVIE